MKRIDFCCIGLTLFLSVGCACSQPQRYAKMRGNPAPMMGFAAAPQEMAAHAAIAQDRVILRRAYLHMETKNIAQAVQQVAKIINESGGYIDNSSISQESNASITARIPKEKFDITLQQITGTGKEKERRMSAEDVTEQVTDIEATLSNKKALRDRLRKLIERANEVKDIGALEEQLARLQSEIDSMEGRLKYIRTTEQLVPVDVYFTRQVVLGPLGYVVKGITWAIGKLFVIN
jgi:uncharacterized protein YnzC (UPF0291/DUF896 family)